MTHLLLGVCINLILIVVLAMNIYFMNNNIEKMSDNIVCLQQQVDELRNHAQQPVISSPL